MTWTLIVRCTDNFAIHHAKCSSITTFSHSSSPELLSVEESSGNLVCIVLVEFVGAVSEAGVSEEMVILM